jgi:hypothetical protein
MAKVTPLKAGFGPRNLGTFKIEKFSMFEEDELEKYADLRNRANDASQGVKIEMMREYERKVTTREGAGNDLVVTTTEEIILVVHYWEKTPKRNKGDSNDELQEAKKDWSDERTVG